METIRLYPAVPVLLPRVAPADTVLDSFLIPAGTIVSSFAYGIHRDQSVFGSQYPVDEFVPERWLDTTERVGKMQQRFWGFGSGARSCVGRQ